MFLLWQVYQQHRYYQHFFRVDERLWANFEEVGGELFCGGGLLIFGVSSRVGKVGIYGGSLGQ